MRAEMCPAAEVASSAAEMGGTSAEVIATEPHAADAAADKAAAEMAGSLEILHPDLTPLIHLP